MELAAEIELPFSEFWEITPYELQLKAEKYYEKKKNRYKDEITLFYLNAYWTIQWLGKNKPRPLEKILKGLDKEKKVMTDEQMLNQVKMLNKIFGGDVIKKAN